MFYRLIYTNSFRAVDDHIQGAVLSEFIALDSNTCSCLAYFPDKKQEDQMRIWADKTAQGSWGSLLAFYRVEREAEIVLDTIH